MKLWIGNVAPGTSDDEVRALLGRYGADTVGAIERVEGDGSRPAAIVELELLPENLDKISNRLNGLYWKGRSLTVQAMTR
ncbi:MAG TPA: hypothetical protein VLT89_11705 [Usitatibacter sp.]|nr:hypothetical protein [Usitatibacter sp.]